MVFAVTLEGPFFTSAAAVLPTVEKFRTILRQRFEQLPYPCSYPLSERNRKTFLEHLQSKGVLEAVFSDHFLEDVRSELGGLYLDSSARALIEEQVSAHRPPIAFHRGVVQAIYQNLMKIRTLMATYDVPNEWTRTGSTSRYFFAANEQILREMQAIYPFFPVSEPPDFASKTPGSWKGLVARIHEIVLSEMEKAGLQRGRKALADQLTSIILSPSAVSPLKSETSPEAVRKYVARKKNKRTKKASKTK
jgi:hypothetical protein